jgi:hypothetical protein
MSRKTVVDERRADGGRILERTFRSGPVENRRELECCDGCDERRPRDQPTVARQERAVAVSRVRRQESPSQQTMQP